MKPTVLDKAENLSNPSKPVTQEFGGNIISLTAYFGKMSCVSLSRKLNIAALTLDRREML